MDKLITNELSLGLDQKLRDDLIDNFKIIQNGVDGQADKTNKQILDLLGAVPLQDQNEVTQARIDVDGSQYETLKGRLDANQETADTALAEERRTHSEVESARVNGVGHTYSSIKTRLDEQETDLTQAMNEKISQISSIPETFANLSALKAAYPNGRTGLFVTADNGHKYIWSNNTWSDAGVYQSVGISDEEQKAMASLALSYDDYIDGGSLIGATANNIAPYKAANSGTLAEFKPNTIGENWVRFHANNNAFTGGIVGYNVSGSDDYRYWNETMVSAKIHNNATVDLPLNVYVNGFGTDGTVVASYKPLLNISLRSEVEKIKPNETMEVTFKLPALSDAFKGQKVTRVELNFVHPGKDLSVDFLLRDVRAKLVNTHVSNGAELTTKESLGVKKYIEPDNLVVNGDFISQNDFPLFGNSGSETLTWIPNVYGKNWLNVVSKDVTKYGKGVAFDYFVNYDNTKFLKFSDVLVSTTVIKKDTTQSALHLYAHVYVYDDTDKIIGQTAPKLTSNNSVNLNNNVQTSIQFRVPLLSEITTGIPARVRVALVSDVKEELVDMLVTDFKVAADNKKYLAYAPTLESDKQIIQSYLEADSFVKGGSLVTYDYGDYLANTNTETQQIVTINDKKWLNYMSSANIGYKGFRTEWRVDGGNLHRLYQQIRVKFDISNGTTNDLKFIVTLFDENNARVGIYFPELTYFNSGLYHEDIVLPSPADMTFAGNKMPVKVVISVTDVVPEHPVNFFITGLNVTANEDVRYETKSNLPEIRIIGDVSAMTKDIASLTRLDFIHPSGKKETVYSKTTWQGNSSLAYAKKNYKLKLYDANFDEKVSFSPFSDIKRDKKFTLKANWIDATHSRNIVNADIYAAMTATRESVPDGLFGAEKFGQITGHPINLFINGEYKGLYTFNTTKADNMVNMDEDEPKNIAMQAGGRSDETLFKVDEATFEDGVGFELISPDEPTDAVKASVNRLLKFVNSSTDDEFVKDAKQYLDLPSMIDYYIFVNATQDSDGTSKNISYFTYDGKKWSAVAYDMDATWSLHWAGGKLNAVDESLMDFWGNKLFVRLSALFKDEIKARYAELRQTVLRSDAIIDRFTKFMNDVGKENYDSDRALWTDIPSMSITNLQQLRRAITQRLIAVDKQFKNL